MNILNKARIKFLGLDNSLSRHALLLQRKYRLRAFKKKEAKVLEICGGSNPYDINNINVDVMDHPLVDVVVNIAEKLPFEDGEIDRIISVATLEHFNILNMRKVLAEFYRILKKDGSLEIGVPSLSKIFEYWKINGCDDKVIRYLHGAQKDEYDLHLCILDFARWKTELEKIGFSGIEETEYDYPFHSKDFMIKIRAIKKS